MASFKHQHRITLIQQQIQLKRTYPQLIEDISIKRNELNCIIRLQPSPESIVYKVRICYKLKKSPKAFLIEPKQFARFNGQKPHHLYKRNEDGKEYLCVFHPRDNVWHANLFLADTFVPWVVTWLSAYEIWQITGKWVYPEYHDEKKNEEEYN